ncbi:hypothetical protein V1478_004360 [Vespula squamosa]|uniref:Uncharacterized protein n=1 Tax=Vespula squamosa TaxID=30214 RepID=A0ABD2BH64_VESSQ
MVTAFIDTDNDINLIRADHYIKIDPLKIDGNILISKIDVKENLPEVFHTNIIQETDETVLTHVKNSKHEQFIKDTVDSYNLSKVCEVGIQMDLILMDI